MTDWSQFDDQKAEAAEQAAAQPAACQVCEAMLPDAVDGLLSEAEQRAFDRHVAGCVVCARELEEAQRGAAWLHMLKQQAPEPSAALLERILAQAPGAQAALPSPVFSAKPMQAGAALPPPRVRSVSAWQSISEGFRSAVALEWMRPMLQPRMAMTAAMAFFSIALTLNLTGVRLNDLSTASLRPSSLRRTVADRGASAVRSFQNLRVVYQAEAQVNDLRSSWQAQEEEAAPAPQAPQPKQQNPQKPEVPEAPGKPQGSSRLDFAPLGLQGTRMTRKGA